TFALFNSAGNANFVSAGAPTWSTNVVTKYQPPSATDLWLALIDGDHVWRQDSQTTRTQLYHFNQAGKGNTASWEMTGLPSGMYKVEADWASNIFVRNQDRETNITAHATYDVYDGNTLVATRVLDQDLATLDDTDGLDSYANLGGVTMMGGVKTLLEIPI